MMHWIRCFLAALMLSNTGTVAAEWLLKPGSERVKAGETLEVTVYILNDTDKPIAEGLPTRLAADMRAVNTSSAVTLEVVDPPAELGTPILPGNFRRQTYRTRVPENFSGPVQIALDRLPSARTHVAVEAIDGKPPVVLGDATALRVDTVPEPALSPHEPMYVLVGNRGPSTARFQLSFKYRLFDERGMPARLLPALGKVHFGFTQNSLWDIGGASAPFRDTSYKPSLFYDEPQLLASGAGRHLLGMQAGLEHESNGRDGTRSRSINIAYVKPAWRWFVDDEHYVSVAPKLYGYLERSDNDDIGRYRGHVDLELRYGKRDGWLFSSMLRKGSGPGHSVQLDASYPIRQPFFANAGGFIHFQYFNGYGETLLDYNVRRSPQFRVGFSIVR